MNIFLVNTSVDQRWMDQLNKLQVISLPYHAILGLNLPLLDRFEPANLYLLVD